MLHVACPSHHWLFLCDTFFTFFCERIPDIFPLYRQKGHYAVWLWMSDPIDILNSLLLDEPERPLSPDRTAIQYAAFCGLPSVIYFFGR